MYLSIDILEVNVNLALVNFELEDLLCVNMSDISIIFSCIYFWNPICLLRVDCHAKFTRSLYEIFQMKNIRFLSTFIIQKL